jgi:PKD repeat protein
MASFILRAIDPALWAKVQAKAVAEGLTPKQLILKAIAQYVAIAALLVAGLAGSACAYHSPTAPAAVTVVPSTAAASIRLVAASRADRQLDVVATVLTASGASVTGARVTFMASIGTLSADTVVSDDSGTARTILASTGLGLVRASANGIDATLTVTGGGAGPVATPDPTPAPGPAPGPTPGPLTVTINASPVGTVGMPVTFGLSTAASGAVLWTFGDGATSADHISTSHVYSSAGTFSVSVTVTDGIGRTASAGTSVNIASAPLPPAAPAAFIASIGCPKPTSLTVACNVAATANGVLLPSSTITRVDWDWGDGRISQTNGTGAAATTHPYASSGTYTIFATVTGAPPLGASQTATTATSVTVP